MRPRDMISTVDQVEMDNKTLVSRAYRLGYVGWSQIEIFTCQSWVGGAMIKDICCHMLFSLALSVIEPSAKEIQ